MSAHRARHRAPAGTASATQCSARELIDRLGCPDTRGRVSRQHQAGPRPDGATGTPRIAAPRQSTLAMLAVSAVGAGTAATGAFHAISAPEPASPAPVVFDALVPAPTSTSAPTSATSGAVSAASAIITAGPADGGPVRTAAPAVAAVPTGAADLPAAAPADAVAATVLAEDTHQMDSRQIAALSRSVDLQRADRPAAKPASALDPAGALPGAARRSTALTAALGKLGVPYVWGAAGPNAFDCSGLVQWAFKKVGVSLPRTSKAQSRIGTPVSKGDLRPGDLVFFYTPVSHVGIYMGDGKVVHASEPGKPVKVSQLTRMPFHNARRI